MDIGARVRMLKVSWFGKIVKCLPVLPKSNIPAENAYMEVKN